MARKRKAREASKCGETAKKQQLVSSSSDQTKSAINNENSDQSLLSMNSKIIGEISRIRLTADYFANVSCIDLAKKLLGQVLCTQLSPNGPILTAKIVETEAYVGVEDAASSSFNGRKTPANEPMFMSAGTCFVYMTYGMYHILNISSEGDGAAVLLRAIEPLSGVQDMRRLRNETLKANSPSKKKVLPLNKIGNGPSKLCSAMAITKDAINKENVITSVKIWLESGIVVNEADIVLSKRIGIDRAGKVWADKLLRFYINDSDFVSKKD